MTQDETQKLPESYIKTFFLSTLCETWRVTKML